MDAQPTKPPLTRKEKNAPSASEGESGKGPVKRRRQSAPAAAPAVVDKTSTRKENEPPMAPPQRPRRFDIDIEATDPKEDEHSYVTRPNKIVLLTTSLPDETLARVELFKEKFGADTAETYKDEVSGWHE